MRSAALACAVALLSLSACAGTDAATNSGAGFVGGDGTVTILPADQRQQAPVLAGSTLEGEELSTADHAGQIIVVNVWGSWCAPCRKEAPELVRANQELGSDVAFIGLNTREQGDTAPALAFQRTFGIGYPSIYDPDGKLLLGFGQLPPKAIPSTVVIDAEGRVAARVLGGVDAETLIGIVDDVREPA